MFSLTPQYNRNDLYKDFLLERKLYQLANLFLWVFGYGCLAVYLILIWFFHVRDPKYFLLDVIGILSRISAIVLFKMYEIPTIFSYLYSDVPALRKWSYNTIHKYKGVILDCLLVNLHGKDYNPSLLHMEMNDLIQYLENKINNYWKTGGKIYFAIYFFICILCFYIILIG